jgi:hypothetical protein
MDAKPDENAAPCVINGRTNGRFAKGFSGNPGGSPEATRRAFNKDFLVALARDFKAHGEQVLARVAGLVTEGLRNVDSSRTNSRAKQMG